MIPTFLDLTLSYLVCMVLCRVGMEFLIIKKSRSKYEREEDNRFLSLFSLLWPLCLLAGAFYGCAMGLWYLFALGPQKWAEWLRKTVDERYAEHLRKKSESQYDEVLKQTYNID